MSSIEHGFDKPASIDLLTGINIVVKAWNEVSAITITNCFKHCQVRSETNSIELIAREDHEIVAQLEVSIRQLPYEDSISIDLLLEYSEEQEVANVPSIAELVQQEKQECQDEEEEEAEIVLQSKLLVAQVVDMIDGVALFWTLQDRDTQEQIALAKLRGGARDPQALTLGQSTLDAYIKH